MTELWKDLTFVEQMKRYHKLSTDAPVEYSEVLAIQLLGHAMGPKPINLIQPKAVHHNVYTLFDGKSTISRKDTSQELGMDIYPYERALPRETSPEHFVVKMSKKSERFQWLGEFTGLLKGISGSGYMARFVEVYNDLHGCPKKFLRELRKKKGQENVFLIEDAYLSINSTVTPEMLRQYLTEEMIEGGFLARWLIVHGKPNPLPRGRLHPDVLKLNETLRFILEAVINMEKEGVNFIFSDEALEQYQAIEAHCYRKYDRILPFVGRYLNYLVSFPDILLVSDAIGVAMEKWHSLYEIKQLKRLINLKSLIQLDNINKRVWEKYSKETVPYLYITIKDIKPSNYLIVSKEHVERAWKIIEPCLDYALTLIDYVELDKPVAKLMEYMKRVKKSSHSKAMQYTHLSSDKMKLAVETLVQRGDIKPERRVVERTGTGKIIGTDYIWTGD